MTEARRRWGEHFARKRIFVRSVESERYTLTQERRKRLAEVPRVFSPKLGDDGEWNIISPEDEPFRTQSLHVHFENLRPGGRTTGHGHQNEAFFYILEGHGYEEHD